MLNWNKLKGIAKEWSSEKQYDTGVMVIHDGTAYVSKRLVEVGTDIASEDDWYKIDSIGTSNSSGESSEGGDTSDSIKSYSFTHRFTVTGYNNVIEKWDIDFPSDFSEIVDIVVKSSGYVYDSDGNMAYYNDAYSSPANFIVTYARVATIPSPIGGDCYFFNVMGEETGLYCDCTVTILYR